MSKYTQTKIKAKLAAKVKESAVELSPEQLAELQVIGEDIRSLGKRTTAEALKLASYLAHAKRLLPEKSLGAWVTAVCKFTPKTARNYIAVHEHLSEHSDRIVAAAIAPTMLFVLAYAKQEDVEEVLSVIEAGEQLTVAQVKTKVGVSKAETSTPKTEVLNIGGLAGLRKLAEIKLEKDAARFLELTTSVLKQVEEALQPLARNRAVRKGGLYNAVQYDCRHAHDLMNSIAASLTPEVVQHINWRAEKLPEGTAWRKVQALLHRMGGEDWPGRTEFVPWLQNEVLPLLRFAALGKPIEDEASIRDAHVADIEDADLDGPLSLEATPNALQQNVEPEVKDIPVEEPDDVTIPLLFDRKPVKHRAA